MDYPKVLFSDDGHSQYLVANAIEEGKLEGEWGETPDGPFVETVMPPPEVEPIDPAIVAAIKAEAARHAQALPPPSFAPPLPPIDVPEAERNVSEAAAPEVAEAKRRLADVAEPEENSQPTAPRKAGRPKRT